MNQPHLKNIRNLQRLISRNFSHIGGKFDYL